MKRIDNIVKTPENVIIGHYIHHVPVFTLDYLKIERP